MRHGLAKGGIVLYDELHRTVYHTIVSIHTTQFEFLKTLRKKGELDIENTYMVLPYIRISNEVGRVDNFLALARQLSNLPTD